jgi:hypothetical protein
MAAWKRGCGRCAGSNATGPRGSLPPGTHSSITSAAAASTTILRAAAQAVLAEYHEHCNAARPHQGTGPRIPDGGPCPLVTAAGPGMWQIRRKPVLSSLISEYQRQDENPAENVSPPAG